MASETPRCRLCGKRPARDLSGVGKAARYVHPTTDRVWCSLSCAAVYALTHWDLVAVDTHWCPHDNNGKGAWVEFSADVCHDCRTDSDDGKGT